MPFKTITVTDEAYNAIKRLKRNDESFSELFNRISPKVLTVNEMFGSWKISDAEFVKLKKTIAANRKQLDKESEERFKRHFGSGK